MEGKKALRLTEQRHYGYPLRSVTRARLRKGGLRELERRCHPRKASLQHLGGKNIQWEEPIEK